MWEDLLKAGLVAEGAIGAVSTADAYEMGARATRNPMLPPR
jgi:hypothetical protein